MSLKLTHKPTDWLFSVEEIIVDCEEQIKNYQKYTDSAVSDMARGYLSIYESRKEMALALQQKDTRFITVKAAYDQAPILDLNSALINGDFEYTLPSTFNTFSARPCSNQLQAYGAYYDLNHILEKSNQEVAEQAESLKNDTSKSYSTYSALILSAAQKFNTAVERLISSSTQNLMVTFDRGSDPDQCVKTKIHNFTL